jgi:phosphate transport system substrate-binding protein
MKKFICAAALALMATTAVARDQIKIVGSSTVYPFTTIVAEKHGQKGFKTPVVESTGTGGGMKLFCAGLGPVHPDFTNASRHIKKSEVELCNKNGVNNIIEMIVGNDGIAFANSINAIQFKVTREELWQAMSPYGDRPTNWNQINPEFPDQRIHILAPPPTSGTRDAWVELVMAKGCQIDDKTKCQEFRQDGAVEEAGENDTLIVKRLAADNDLFGIFGFSFLDQNGDKIQGSIVENVEISLDNIQTYEYPISRPLYVYAKGEHVGVIPGMQEFMNEYVSDAAMGEWGYLGDAGLVPLDSKTLADVRSNVK